MSHSNPEDQEGTPSNDRRSYGHHQVATIRSLPVTTAGMAQVVVGLVVLAHLAQVIIVVPLAGMPSPYSGYNSVPIDQRTIDEAISILRVWDVSRLVTLALFVAAWITTAIWLTSSIRFVRAAAPGTRFRLGAAWAWLGWVVPVVALWFPRIVVDDLWRSTVAVELPDKRNRIGGWWGLWLTALFFDYAATLNDSNFGALVGSVLIATVLMTIAGFRWGGIIGDITDTEVVIRNRLRRAARRAA